MDKKELTSRDLSHGDMDHVLELLSSRDHPFILVGVPAHRWMGSSGNIATRKSCDLLIRESNLKEIATDLISGGHWELHDPGVHLPSDLFHRTEIDADLVLRRTRVTHQDQHAYLCLWTETTYRISIDGSSFVKVPDTYSWHHILVEENWHPALGREDGWWFGPRLSLDTQVPNLPACATLHNLFPEGFPRGKSSSLAKHSVLVPSLPTYLDALVHHATQYKTSKPGLALSALWQIGNLTRYLYLELPHQQLPLLIEMEEYEFMEKFLQNYRRKPFYIYRRIDGCEIESARVQEWDPDSYPDWRKKTD